MVYFQQSLFGRTSWERFFQMTGWTLEPCSPRSQPPTFQCFRAGAGNRPGHGGKAEYDRLQALCGPQAQVRHRLCHRNQRPPLRGTLFPQMARRQETRPQHLRPYPRGVRGEAEDTDRGDESGDCGSEEAEGFGRR